MLLVHHCWATRPSHWNENQLSTQSGSKIWVDPETPQEVHAWETSRGDTWELVMSDEFNTPGRSFRPGDDHMWTSIEKPDGVNAAMEIYAHNKTTTACDESHGVCSFQIELEESVIQLRVWNGFLSTPGFQNVTFFYRGGMVQSWNKFCMQGGLVEIRAQLPGALSESSGNPDISLDSSGRAQSLRYYPAWPGIWMMGNLGRAIFSGSTNRMWPFSYDACDPDTFDPKNQRISACDADPGSGMNPHQGRGAPEIDILEGGGTSVSISIQVGPGMPPEFRIIKPVGENELCVYSSSCQTPGANVPGMPESLYAKSRGHESWYQSLRYAANNFCERNASQQQSFATVDASLDAGIEDNTCSVTTCPASYDINSDLGFMNDNNDDRWGINLNGTCFSAINSYMGEFICSAGNPDPRCEPLEDGQEPRVDESSFAFQIDALSANWPVHMAAYTEYVEYQVEWVPGPDGYVRWMLAGNPLYEIPAQAVTNPPQGASVKNPAKVMIEEPLYLIFNVAMSSKWGAQPPNPKLPCRGDGMDPVANQICDALPMYLKIDYIRVYQDVSPTSTMSLGCDPETYPTRQWIFDHREEYEDEENKLVEVHGKAFCRTDLDCTTRTTHRHLDSSEVPVVLTGRCVKKRCVCLSETWTGPRCIVPRNPSAISFGPPIVVAACVGSILFVLGFASCVAICFPRKVEDEAVETEHKAKKKPQQRPQYELLRRQSSRNLHSSWMSE
uniref:Beta-glucan synthesis-associated protein n=1 Tax=Peronospora matthiolae TaxID=2874970 RepID=A0AAV1UC11_9STRA